VKIIAIQIANGYSPEARVLATLLGARDDAYDGVVLHHTWPGDTTSTDRFEEEARMSLARLDMGWRPNPSARRSFPAKVLSWARFQIALRDMVRRAAKFDPDIIVSCQQRWDCFAASAIAAKLGKPQIVHLHYTVGPWLGRSVLDRLHACDHVVAISDFIRQDALRHGVPPDRVTTVLSPVKPMPVQRAGTREEARAELNLPVDARVIGIAARFDPYKGQRDSIAAFARLAATDAQAYLVIVGSSLAAGGIPRSQLESEAAATGVGHRILFTGQRSDVPRILSALDIFVHPSRNEPFGLAIAEASAAGLPVVAYAEGAVPEIVADGQTGLLAPPGDVDGLATRLAMLINDPARGRMMGAAGRQRIAEHFPPGDAARAFADVLAGVLA